MRRCSATASSHGSPPSTRPRELRPRSRPSAMRTLMVLLATAGPRKPWTLARRHLEVETVERLADPKDSGKRPGSIPLVLPQHHPSSPGRGPLSRPCRVFHQVRDRGQDSDERTRPGSRTAPYRGQMQPPYPPSPSSAVGGRSDVRPSTDAGSRGGPRPRGDPSERRADPTRGDVWSSRCLAADGMEWMDQDSMDQWTGHGMDGLNMEGMKEWKNGMKWDWNGQMDKHPEGGVEHAEEKCAVRRRRSLAVGRQPGGTSGRFPTSGGDRRTSRGTDRSVSRCRPRPPRPESSPGAWRAELLGASGTSALSSDSGQLQQLRPPSLRSSGRDGTQLVQPVQFVGVVAAA